MYTYMCSNNSYCITYATDDWLGIEYATKCYKLEKLDQLKLRALLEGYFENCLENAVMMECNDGISLFNELL